jgi:putative peptidoglycan lipid II flippase
MVGVAAIVGVGLAVYFPAAWLLGGMDKEALKTLLRRKRKVA